MCPPRQTPSLRDTGSGRRARARSRDREDPRLSSAVRSTERPRTPGRCPPPPRRVRPGIRPSRTDRWSRSWRDFRRFYTCLAVTEAALEKFSAEFLTERLRASGALPRGRVTAVDVGEPRFLCELLPPELAHHRSRPVE